PLGQPQNRLPKGGLSRQIIGVEKPRRIAMRWGRAAAVDRFAARIVPCVGAVRRCVRWQGMGRLSEGSVIVGGAILLRVTAADVDAVSSQRQSEIPPGSVSRAGELSQAAFDDVILIVVVRDDRRSVVAGWALVVGPELAPVPPAELIDDLSPGRQAALRVDRRL